MTMIREARPSGLFGYFKEHNIMCTNPYKGIYYVKEKRIVPDADNRHERIEYRRTCMAESSVEPNEKRADEKSAGKD